MPSLTFLYSVLILDLALLLTGAGAQSPKAASGSYSYPLTCDDGTVASYLGTSCSQGLTVYHWLSYSCTSTPASICDRLGVNGANLRMDSDPNGPYTIMVGETKLWDVTAGQSVDVVIKGTVYGAMRNNNWSHYRGLIRTQGDIMDDAPLPGPPGQTGDGMVEAITTVDCKASGNCTNDLNGVSDELCDAAHYTSCVDQKGIPYQYDATFKVNTAADPYPLAIEIKLNGGNHGTAHLSWLGTHLNPYPPGAMHRYPPHTRLSVFAR
jgi:hypothetical protein